MLTISQNSYFLKHAALRDGARRAAFSGHPLGDLLAEPAPHGLGLVPLGFCSRN